jgi:replicative DNA helicase
MNNLDLEFAAVGLLMDYPDDVWKDNGLSEIHFKEKYLGKLYEKIKAEIYKGDFSGRIFFKLQEVEDRKYLLKAMGEASGHLLSQVSKALINLSNARKLKDLLELKATEITPESDINEILASIDSQFSACQDVFQVRTEKEVYLDIAKELDNDLPCYSTGYSHLDMAMAGGLYQKKNYCIAARMKTGKTVSLASISHNLSKQGVKHLYIAAEMTASEILKRNLAHEVGRNPIAFYDKQSRQDDKFNKQVNQVARASEGAGIYCDAPSISFDKLKRFAISAVKKYGIKGLILDYLQIVTGDQNNNEAQFQGQVAQWLAEFSKKENVFVLYAAQLNRDGLLRGSDGIKMAVDQLYTMHAKQNPVGDEARNRWFVL